MLLLTGHHATEMNRYCRSDEKILIAKSFLVMVLAGEKVIGQKKKKEGNLHKIFIS